MARIPDEELERIKRDVPLTDLCSRYGIALKPQGQDFAAHCPFHDDRTPSFIITPLKNLWNCLGACGRGGSNIDLVMKCEKVSFIRAVERLREIKGEIPTAPVLKTRQGTEHPILVEPGRALENAALLEQVTHFYHQTFLNHPQAMQYLQQRGCFHPEAVTRFKLGYANRSLGYRLPAQNVAGRALREQLQKIGIYRESGHEHLSGCVVVPIIHDGQITGLYGRRITKIKSMQEGTPHLYLPGPHVGVWNSDELKCREWLLCEAAIDALSLWCHGFRNVTWSYGVNGFSSDHWQLVRAARPERIIVCYDNDDAGNKAANELAQKLAPEGIAAWRIQLPPHSDINDLVRSSQDPKAALASLLAAAERMLPASSALPSVIPLAWDHESDQPTPFVTSESFEGIGWVHEKDAEALHAMAPQNGQRDVVPGSVTEAAKKEKQCAAAPNDASAFHVSDDGREATLQAGERLWRVRGLDANSSFDHLKINLRLSCRDKFHLDTFDLYQARQRTAFIAQAQEITGCGKAELESDLAALIAHLETHQEKKIMASMTPVESGPVITPEEEMAALKLLKEPQLFERILADYATVGTVGEDANKLLGYLIAVSRKLDDPLSGLIVSRSAAGKSSLLGAILDLVPEEDKKVVTSMTAQSLYYLPDDGLKNKVLAVMEDEGSQNASYPLKILQSEKKLILAVTVKDAEGGMPKTELKTVEGPVAQFMTSTQAEFDEELANRYLVLSVDEDREQTRRIHAAQREAETLRGMLRKLDREETVRIHHNAQRLLRPLRVVNPFADRLTFPDDQLRLRRDHKKYLSLIKTIAFLRQYQKPIRSCDHRGKTIQYIEVDETDLRLAHGLAGPVLGRSLDELAPPTRTFLAALEAFVHTLAKERKLPRDRVRFSRREVREYLKWSEPQVRRHLDKLAALEYVTCHRMAGTGARFVYELLPRNEASGTSTALAFVMPERQSSPKNGVRHGLVTVSSAPHDECEPLIK
jgi:DNA primase catalytic core